LCLEALGWEGKNSCHSMEIVKFNAKTALEGMMASAVSDGDE